MPPENPESAREVILCIAQGVEGADVFQLPSWAGRWTHVTQEASDAITNNCGAHLQLSPGMDVPRLSNSDGALWISELDQLEAALKDESWNRIIFAPSVTAVLDALRLQRQTLAVRGDLNRGDILRCEDITVVEGGEGIAATLLDTVAGQALCYDLDDGEPITFGMIVSAPSENDNTSTSPDGPEAMRRTARIKPD